VITNPKFTHDIRNCVNAISINAELGKLGLKMKNDPEIALRALEKILTECKKCAEILNHNTDEH
jgi:signal transduction histidine kinase